ncbi:MAG TPA: hypothetical protein VF652_05690 [Allosphingosinicella sp.]|jgi:hypothetical protein
MKQADIAATAGSESWKAFGSRHKCSFLGWLSAWVTMTFLSAAIFAIQQGKLAALINATWHAADDVPPYAKLSLGAVLILLLAGFARLGERERSISYPAAALAGLLAISAVFLLAPFDYYTAAAGGGAPIGTWMLPHLLVGAIGGSCFAFTSRRCRASSKAAT